MFPHRLLLLLLVVLAGCAGPHGGPGLSWSWPGPSPVAASYPDISHPLPDGTGLYRPFDFAWQLAGDPEIMPVQVFDDGARMWLQFPAEGAWPAVFEVGMEGWRPLSYRREPPYMVLEGVYPELALRGGHLQGVIRRLIREPEIAAEVPSPSDTPSAAILTEGSFTAPVAVPASIDTSSEGATPAPVTEVPVEIAAPFIVSPADVTIRQALARWAQVAGWTFSAEHWAVDVDIPLVGAATFETDFKSAVRELLAATEMGDRPLQPCFYSNRVVRVVPYAQACDRRKGMGVVS